MIDDFKAIEEKARKELYGEHAIRTRPHSEIKMRASGDPDMKDVRILTGYPCVFNQATVLYEDDSCIVRETIAPGFFDDVLENDCHLNYVHESGSAMCRNNPCMPDDRKGGPGSMELSCDPHGLRIFARVPMNDPDAQRMAVKMDNGVVDEMSFAFDIAPDGCDSATTHMDDGRVAIDYTLRSCKRLYDVTVCPLGAYSQTEAALRSITSGIKDRPDGGSCDSPVRSEEGREPDGHDDGLEETRFVDEAKSRIAEFKFIPIGE